MADNALTIQISADTGAAATSIGDLETRLAALEKAYIASAGATKAHAAATSESTIETRVAKEAATGLGGALDALATHYRIVTAGSEALGLETSGLAAKFAGLGEVVKGLGKAFAPLLIALVAFEVAFKGFEYLKDATGEAAEMQAQLETLGATIDNVGGSWAASSGAIKTWIDQEAMASGFLRSELVPSLNQLVTAGNSVSDSEKILAVSEEVAIAKHKDVKEIVSELITAEMGRGMALEKEDANLKGVVTTHGHLSDALKILHNDYKNQIEDGDSAERTFNRLKVELEGVSLVIGEKLLPLLVNMGYELIGAVKNAEMFGDGIVKSFASIIDAARAAAEAVLALRDVFSPTKQANDDFNSHWKKAGDLFRQSQGESDRSVNEMFGQAEAGVVGRNVAGSAVAAHAKHVQGLGNLDNNPIFGNAKKSGGGSGAVPTDMPDQFADEVPEKALKNLDALVELHNKLTASEETLRHSMEMSTSTTELNAKALELKSLKAADAEVYEKALNAAVIAGTETQKQDIVAVNNTHDAYEEARAALNAFSAAHAGATKETLATKEQHVQLAEAVKNTTKAHLEAEKALSAVNSTLNTHIGQLNAARLASQKLADQETEDAAAIARKWATAQEALADNYIKSVSLNEQKNADERATYGRSLAEQISYFEKEKANLDQYAADYLAKYGALENKISDLQEAEYKKSTDDAKKAFDEMQKAYEKYVADSTKQTASFIDDVVIKHKSLKDELKTVFDDILKQYVDMIAKMIVQSSLFKDIFPFQGTSGGSMFGGLLGGSGKSGTAPDGTAGSPIHVTTADAGSAFLSKTTGSSTGVSAASAMASLNAAGYSGPDMSNSSFSGGSSDWGANATSGSTTSALSKLLGGALTGAALGSTGSSLTGGNSIGGAVGGVAGDAIGMMLGKMIGGAAGGPVGAVLGSLLGGAVGGMFGPHETAAQQPDLNDSTWGQDLANWQGGGVTVGNNFVTPGSQYDNSNGGSSQSIDIANWVKDNQNNISSLTAAQQTMYQQMLTLMGGNANAGAGAIGIANEHQGMVTLTDGTTMSVTDFESMVSNFNSTVGGAGGAGGAIPTFNISRPYPDSNSSTATQNGSIPAGGINSTPTVNITVNGSIVGTNGMVELATTVSQTMYDQSRGTQPIAGGGNMFNRTGGGF